MLPGERGEIAIAPFQRPRGGSESAVTEAIGRVQFEEKRDLSQDARSLGRRGKFWRVGAYELYRSFSKTAFVEALQRLVPELGMTDVHRGGAGVRAQALGRDGRLLDDFVIRESERALHVINAPSPAATASLAIAEHLVDQALERFQV